MKFERHNDSFIKTININGAREAIPFLTQALTCFFKSTLHLTLTIIKEGVHPTL